MSKSVQMSTWIKLEHSGKMGPVERSSSSGHVELCAVYTLVVFLQFLPKQLGKLCRSRVKSQTHLKAAHSIQCYTGMCCGKCLYGKDR